MPHEPGHTSYSAPEQNAVGESKAALLINDFITDEELTQLRKDIQSGEVSGWDAKWNEIASQTGSTPELVRTYVNNLIKALPVDTAKISEAQFKQARNQVRAEVTEVAIQAAGLGIGLAQAISAGKGLKEMKQPQFAQRDQDFSQLDTLINDVRKRASGEMPARERGREREFDEIVSRANQTATKFGVQGAGFQQAAAIQASKARRAGELDDEQISMGYTQLLGNLLQMKEGMLQQSDAQRERLFQGEQQRSLQTQQALGQQQAAGFQNIYQAGTAFARGVSGLPSVLDVFRDSKLAIHKQQQDQATGDAMAERDRRINNQANIY